MSGCVIVLLRILHYLMFLFYIYMVPSSISDISIYTVGKFAVVDANIISCTKNSIQPFFLIFFCQIYSYSTFSLHSLHNFIHWKFPSDIFIPIDC